MLEVMIYSQGLSASYAGSFLHQCKFHACIIFGLQVKRTLSSLNWMQTQYRRVLSVIMNTVSKCLTSSGWVSYCKSSSTISERSVPKRYLTPSINNNWTSTRVMWSGLLEPSAHHRCMYVCTFLHVGTYVCTFVDAYTTHTNKAFHTLMGITEQAYEHCLSKITG